MNCAINDCMNNDDDVLSSKERGELSDVFFFPLLEMVCGLVRFNAMQCNSFRSTLKLSVLCPPLPLLARLHDNVHDNNGDRVI